MGSSRLSANTGGVGLLGTHETKGEDINRLFIYAIT